MSWGCAHRISAIVLALAGIGTGKRLVPVAPSARGARVADPSRIVAHLAVVLLIALSPLVLGPTEQAHAATSSRTLLVGMGGGTSQTAAYDAASSPPSSIQSWYPYTSSFTGGARVALGDVNGDGTPDAITAPGSGTDSTITVYDGRTVGPATPAPMNQFFPFAGFTGGVFVAAGDVNGDGAADVVAATDAGSVPQVKVLHGRTGAVLASFTPFDSSFRGGVRVATGDVNGDGRADVVVGAGPGGGSRVKVFDGTALFGTSPTPIREFFAFSAGFTGGVFVAAGDVNGDGADDVVAATDAGAQTQVKVFDGRTSSTELANFLPFTGAFQGGARVATGDVDGDGRADVVVGAGPGGGPRVKVFGGTALSGTSPTPIRDFFALDLVHDGGVYVAGPRVPRATQLHFSVQPGGAHVNEPLNPQPVVQVLDSTGTLVTSFTGPVTLTFHSSPQGAALNGTTTVTAVNGVATFTDISISTAYSDYQLRADSGSLTPRFSFRFAITEPPPTGATHLLIPTSIGNAVAG